MFGVPCGCQTTLSLNNMFMPIMDKSITQRICNRSLASTTHPQKNYDQNPITSQKRNPSGVRFSCPEPWKWWSHTRCTVWTTWFHLGEGVRKEHSLAPQGFCYLLFMLASKRILLHLICPEYWIWQSCASKVVYFTQKMGSARFLLTQIGIGTPSPRGIDGFFQEYRSL